MADTRRIFVTGGAGYIGATLVPRLLEAGHRVTVLDTLVHPMPSVLSDCPSPNFAFVQGDARDPELVAPLLSQADVIIPLAGIVGAPRCKLDPAGAVSTNRDAILMLLERISDAQDLLIPSTNSGYGKRESGTPCTEDSPLNPISLYARTKVDAEAAVLATGRGISFRLATAFGASPQMRTDLLVNDFVQRAFRGEALSIYEPHFTRNYIHVRDVAGAFLHGIQNYDAMKGRAYNVGLSDANLSKWELCTIIKRHLPDFAFTASERGEDPDQRNYVVSNARIESTGWQPAYSLDDGIRELIATYATLTD